MARVTISDLQEQVAALKAALEQAQEDNEKLRVEINGVRMVVSVAMNTLERAMR